MTEIFFCIPIPFTEIFNRNFYRFYRYKLNLIVNLTFCFFLIKQKVFSTLIFITYSNLQYVTVGVSKSVVNISEIYVSEYNGYFIGDDVKNALEITNNFIAKEFNTTQIVSLYLN